MSVRIPITLGFYLGKKFLQTVLLTLLGLFGLVFLIDLVELLRRAASRETGIPFTSLIEMALLKSPQMSVMLLPYAVLIGMMLTLAKLTRTSELIVTRAAGISVWQFLAPGLGLMIALGAFFLAVISPLSATMLARYERLEARLLTGQSSLLAVSSSGLWLRQQERNNPEVGEYIIHALRVSEQGEKLSDVTVFVFDKQKSFIRRLEANTAMLLQGEWVLQDVTISRPGQAPERVVQRRLPTVLTLSQIQDSFASPETLSFWELPPFIKTLENAGFSASRHRLYWHRLMSIPLLLSGMVMLAALFSMRLPRRGGVLYLISAGLLTGFVLLFISDIIFALGLSGTLPLWLAAWMPPMACAGEN